MSEAEPVLPLRTVTCRTARCENRGLPIRLRCGGEIRCGSCDRPITDVVDD